MICLSAAPPLLACLKQPWGRNNNSHFRLLSRFTESSFSLNSCILWKTLLKLFANTPAKFRWKDGGGFYGWIAPSRAPPWPLAPLLAQKHKVAGGHVVPPVELLDQAAPDQEFPRLLKDQNSLKICSNWFWFFWEYYLFFMITIVRETIWLAWTWCWAKLCYCCLW